MRVVAALGLGIWLCSSCGAKIAGENGANAADGSQPAEKRPPPACSALCDRFVALCGGGPSAACVSECESTKSKFASCQDTLDAFLDCMGTARVDCSGQDVVILDCSPQRVALDKCGAH
jgi:hypothetical protein